MKRLIFLFTGLILLLSACQKGELPVKKADRGTAITKTIELGSNYEFQIWYKLKGNAIVSTNSKYDWDLAFEGGDKGNHVLMNSSKMMFARNTGTSNFDDVKDTIGFANAKQCDRVASLDSNVLGVFESNSPVFIIDLGTDINHKPIGIKKLQFVENTPTTFSFKYSNIDGSDLHTPHFGKSNKYNFLQFSIRDSILKANLEPEKDKYDLVFTPYTYVFVNPTLPYLVQGVLINRNNVQVSRIEGKLYENVSLKDTLQVPFANQLDAIGYTWKTYNFTTAHYDINPYTYIIKDVEGYFYKLQFTDFYQNNMKGFPKFEYQKL